MCCFHRSILFPFFYLFELTKRLWQIDQNSKTRWTIFNAYLNLNTANAINSLLHS